MRSLLRHGADRRALRAFAERQELVKAGLTRRDLLKMGLLTTGGVGGGFVLADKSLADDGPGPLPPLTPFLEPLPILPMLPERAVTTLDPAPTKDPNRATNPATNLPFEGRTETHQSEDLFPPQAFFETRMGATTVKIHPDLPAQTLWGFNQGGADLTADPPLSPGPVLVMRYGRPSIVRRHNALPPPAQNGGFGVPEVSTHLHNFHSCPDSDGGPCDPVQQRFFSRGQYYDYFYNLQFAGWGSTNKPDGNIQEALGSLWYHDHRVDHTAENTYKGLVGAAILFNDFDTGNEETGFRLPTFDPSAPGGGFDIPLVFADKLIDPTTGLIAFDTFQNDGLIGNTFLTNGKVQPFLDVAKRRYRFRLLDAGPSRFYQFFLTNPDNLGQSIPFWVISNDGNLLPRPVEVTSHRISVAERADVIIDFGKIFQRFGKPARIRLENRLEQLDGLGPTGRILPAGHGDQVLEFILTDDPVTDDSFDPEPVSFPHVPATAGDAVFAPISLPDISTVQPRLTRTFVFGQHDDGWQINDEFMDCTRFRFSAQANTAERWIIQNDGGEWQHPIHIHLEEFRILSRNGVAVKAGNVQFSRKDVTALLPDERIEVLMRFRDNLGVYPFHCHNTVHEDHQMMLLFDVAPVGDTKRTP